MRLPAASIKINNAINFAKNAPGWKWTSEKMKSEGKRLYIKLKHLVINVLVVHVFFIQLSYEKQGIFSTLFFGGISLMSGQLITEYFPDCLKGMFFALCSTRQWQ